MVSIISFIECFRCKNIAKESYCYNTFQRTVQCPHCGYNYSQTQQLVKNSHKFNDNNGYGVACISKKNGTSQYVMYGERNLSEEVERFNTNLEMLDTDRENSFFLVYMHSKFFVTYGNIPDNFFDLYTELLKMQKPYE